MAVGVFLSLLSEADKQVLNSGSNIHLPQRLTFLLIRARTFASRIWSDAAFQPLSQWFQKISALSSNVEEGGGGYSESGIWRHIDDLKCNNLDRVGPSV